MRTCNKRSADFRPVPTRLNAKASRFGDEDVAVQKFLHVDLCFLLNDDETQRLLVSARVRLKFPRVGSCGPEIVLGVLVIVLCPDRVADLSFSASKRKIPLNKRSRVLGSP